MTTRPSGATCAVCVEHVEEGLHVAGMDCGDEIALLEQRLGRLPGFESLSADLVGQRVRVSYDRSRLSSDDIVQAVAETGMRAWPESRHAVSPVPESAAPSGWVVASGALLLAGFTASLLTSDPRWLVPLFAAAALSGARITARRSWASLRSRSLDMNTLMLVAVIGAAAIGEWSEAATVIFLFALAQWLESRSMARARHAIRAVMDLAPAEALVRRDGAEVRVPVGEVRVGETILVQPGERLPLDGRVAAGASEVNQAPITGESLPVDRGPGDDVFAGSINGHAALEVTVTHLRRDTTLARIIALVESAQEQRAPAQAFVDRFARRYTPAVLSLAVLVALVPPLAWGEPFGAWLYRALVLLVISCPCALVISTPVSIVSALAGAARRGVLVKGGLHLERAGRIRAVAFDKTGTLTTGRPAVTGVVPIGDASAGHVLEVAASLEVRSEHPIARAIVRDAETHGVAAPAAGTGFRALPGFGAEAIVDGRPALVGNRRLFDERGLSDAASDAAIAQVAAAGASAVLVAWGGRTIGVIGVADRVRDAALGLAGRLRPLGVTHVAMLTGDDVRAARTVAAAVGVDECLAELLPAGKVDAIGAIRRAHGTVMMVGDGVNDAPALAASDLGVAMGAAGSDVALETADAALMADDLDRVPYLLRLGRSTLAVVRANIAFALGLKALFVALALVGAATLWMAVLADMGASLLVIGNGLRLLRRD